jgi:DNA modification methylase
MNYTDTILQGDVISQMRKLPGDIVDCVVTSPPYWSLRDYEIEGQIGMEEHPQQYISKLVDVFKEIKRVLKPSGTVFLNLGDSYYTKSGSNFKGSTEAYSNQAEKVGIRNGNNLRELFCDGKWLQSKQKLMLPERTAIALQDDGWILRNNIIWYKPNHMPCSVTDRLTGSYESVFLLVKDGSYYFNLDIIRKPHIWAQKDKRSLQRRVEGKSGKITEGKYATNAVGYNPLGGNPGDVWSLTTEASFDSHFATFPTKLVKKCLLCGCPKGGLVLDPFTGSGTTLYVARKMNLHYLGIELKPEYVKIAKKRLANIAAPLDSFIPISNPQGVLD